MEAISWLQFSSGSLGLCFGRRRAKLPMSFPAHRQHAFTLRVPTISFLKIPSTSVDECAEDDVLQEFFQDRWLNGDLITKYSDILFQKKVMKLDDRDATYKDESFRSYEENQEMLPDDPEGGFLKLSKTQEWLLGETPPPINRRQTSEELKDDRERRRRLNFLKYEALKRELLFMTLGVGAACTVYCLLTLSIEAAVSYASGVGCSCLYLQLLYQHADRLSRDSVPEIFTKKKTKKIGIRSEDLTDTVERTVKGSGIALSSPRLVIPAAIYGFWVLLHQNFASNIFDFQIVPAMLGMFAYKAAALVQVYRDNEDLLLVFPDSDESSDG